MEEKLGFFYTFKRPNIELITVFTLMEYRLMHNDCIKMKD